MSHLQIGCCFALAFFSVLFLQSGFDKVFDWKGNLDWLTPHFANSPFKNMVRHLLGVMTILEVTTGFASVIGLFCVIFTGPSWLPLLAIYLVMSSLLCLFAGQRISKDYAGAATIATYFGVALLAYWLLMGLHVAT